MLDQITIIESILFTAGDPVSVDTLAVLCNVSVDEIQEWIDHLSDRCRQSDRPFQVYQQGAQIQLVTKPEFSETMKSFWENQRAEPLTRAQLETLSTVAYMGPILKSDIDTVRGVQSTITVRTLLMRGLITQSSEGGMLKYIISGDALRHLGVSAVSELPRYDAIHDELTGTLE